METFSGKIRTYSNGSVRIVSKPNTCQRYQCMKCFDVRKARSMARLRSVGLVKTDSKGNKYVIPSTTNRLLHATVGLNVPTLYDVPKMKKYIEKVLTKFHSRLRKIYPRFRAIRVFDMAIDKKTSEYYVHFHYGIFTVKRKKYSSSIMNSILKDITGGKIKVFKIIGMRYKDSIYVKDSKTGKMVWKKGLFDYFAKRMSGYFGHKKFGNNFFLEEVMSWEEADKIFHGTRRLVISSPSVARLGSKTGDNSPKKDEFGTYTEEFLGILWTKKTKDPPPKSWKNLQSFMRYVLQQQYHAVNDTGRYLLQQWESYNWYQASYNKKSKIGEDSLITEYLPNFRA